MQFDVPSQALTITGQITGSSGSVIKIGGNNSVIGRLKSGVTQSQAAAEAAAIGRQIVAEPLARCSQSILGCTQKSNYWGVVLDSRIQSLTQDITACTVLVDSISGTCDFTSTIDFIFQTASANTFNFIFPNVGQGVYTLKVYAGVGSDASIIAGSGTAVGAAAFGLGSVTAETVRLVHGFEF